MAVSPDLYFQNFSTVHGNLQPKPATIASATTIAPTSFLTILTGTTTIQTITPPNSDAMHMLAFTSAEAAVLGTSGNILVGQTFAVNRVYFLIWNPMAAKYIIAAIA
jgi:hypothetical protein